MANFHMLHVLCSLGVLDWRSFLTSDADESVQLLALYSRNAEGRKPPKQLRHQRPPFPCFSSRIPGFSCPRCWAIFKKHDASWHTALKPCSLWVWFRISLGVVWGSVSDFTVLFMVFAALTLGVVKEAFKSLKAGAAGPCWCSTVSPVPGFSAREVGGREPLESAAGGGQI